MTQEQQQWLQANLAYEPVGVAGPSVVWSAIDFLNPNGSLASNPTNTPLINGLELNWTGQPFTAFAVGIRKRASS